jgi:hypothetical protein
MPADQDAELVRYLSAMVHEMAHPDDPMPYPWLRATIKAAARIETLAQELTEAQAAIRDIVGDIRGAHTAHAVAIQRAKEAANAKNGR